LVGDGGDKENQGARFLSDEEIDDVVERDVVDHPVGKKTVAPPAKRDKWADIDAWDMEFEEVEVISGSGGSSPTRR